MSARAFWAIQKTPIFFFLENRILHFLMIGRWMLCAPLLVPLASLFFLGHCFVDEDMKEFNHQINHEPCLWIQNQSSEESTSFDSVHIGGSNVAFDMEMLCICDEQRGLELGPGS